MSNPNFNPTYSTWDIWRAGEMEQCLDDDLMAIEADIAALESGKANTNHTHTGYATVNHTHTEYAQTSDIAAVEALIGDTSVASQITDAIATKADVEHSHDGYAMIDHNHIEYANVTHTHTTDDVIGFAGALNAKYEKAPTGIPKADLASDIQASLGKADTAIQSLAGYATESYVDTAVAGIVESAPETLDTLNELAAALGNDPNFATTVANQIGTKVTAVEGKGLSTNDLTDALKANYDAAHAHVSATNNPHGVNLSQLGVNATATELNYVDGVTSPIQAQLNDKAASNHTHSNYASSNHNHDSKYAASSHTHDYAASSHNHSASNITSGTLPVGRGGTGSTSAKKNVTLNRGADSSSSNFGYDCQYIPYLNMCFVRVYAQPNAAFSADTEYEIATVSSSTYYPASMMALSNYAQREISAYVNTEGKIVVRPYESVGTSYGIRLAGFWFCE